MDTSIFLLCIVFSLAYAHMTYIYFRIMKNLDSSIDKNRIIEAENKDLLESKNALEIKNTALHLELQISKDVIVDLEKSIEIFSESLS